MKTEKKSFILFLILVFGITFLLGSFMRTGAERGKDLTAFPAVLMHLPASGVMLLAFLTQKKSEKKELPRVLFSTFLVGTAVMAAVAIVDILGNGRKNISNLWVGILSIFCLLEILGMGKEKRKAWGLDPSKNWKKSLACLFFFLLLQLIWSGVMTFLICLKTGNLTDFVINIRPQTVFILPFSFLLTFTGFLGEEYGWRWFSQPYLQKKYGKTAGVLILGFLWGLWHMPLDLFGTGFSYGLLYNIFIRLAGCMGKSIFYGWLYMKTENVWAVTAAHFLNNNIGMLIVPAALTADSKNAFMIGISYVIVYFPFLLTKEYKSQKVNNCETFV